MTNLAIQSKAAERGYVVVGGGQMHYRMVGEPGSGSTLVLLHESPLSSAIFEDVLDDLGEVEGLTTWAPDLPGYGESDPPSGQPALEDYADWVLEAADAAGLELFAFAGAHAAASIGVEVARRAPERVTRLLLSGLPLYDEAERAAFFRDSWPLGDVGPDADGEYLGQVWRHYRDWWGPDTSPALMHIAALSVLRNYERYIWILRASLAYDPAPALKELDIPVQFFTAQQDVCVAGDARAKTLRSDIVTVTPGPAVKGQLWSRARSAYVDAIKAFMS
jgi:pimeloyl-ACP methyl ester carboxylesterase